MDVARARYREAQMVTESYDIVAKRKRTVLDADLTDSGKAKWARIVEEADAQLAAAQRREYEAWLQIEALRPQTA